VAFALALPAAFGLPGVTTVEWSWERPSYAAPSTDPAGAPAVHRDERRRAALSLADWATDSVRWEAGAALDRWAQDSHLSVGAGLDQRLADDRVSCGVDTSAWSPVGSGGPVVRSGVSSDWRSTREGSRPSWLVLTGLEATGGAAPLDLWPGAGTGHARTPLLRAHPLLDAGVLNGPVFGRRLAHGTVEYQHPLKAAQTGAIRLAAFADTARAWRRVIDDESPSWHADVGAGLRVALPGHGGTARLDLARGLRDRRVVFSAGWQSPWPGR
jgi:hypothetical protein